MGNCPHNLTVRDAVRQDADEARILPELVVLPVACQNLVHLSNDFNNLAGRLHTGRYPGR